MPQKIIIAIDGNSGCGKSSTAKVLAEKLNYTYIDTGAMYRAVTLYFLQNDIDSADDDNIKAALEKIEISFRKKTNNGEQETYTNGLNVEKEIRNPEVSAHVSGISKIPAVREKLVKEQQRLGMSKGIVMDGRDIGTVVFPKAELKVFMTAELEERAKRRFNEISAAGGQISLEEVRENLKERDLIDSARDHSPLKKAEDAYLLDTTGITFDDQVDTIYNWAIKLIEEN